MRIRNLMLSVLAGLLLTVPVWGATDTIVILHTNDMHDHLRAGYDGVGGLPYVSGYIKSVVGSRPDVLVLDGGDVMEKGDMVSFETKSVVMYEAMARAGYQAGAPGNHDITYGLDWLLRCRETGKYAMLCVSVLDKDKKPVFEPSKIFDVDGVKVGVIGATIPKGDNYLDESDTAIAVAVEADRLEPEVQLIVVVCHLGTASCRAISAVAPNVDVFVSGHTHEATLKPIVMEETGAIIVQAGQYANHVGRLELEVDLDTEKVTQTGYRLVEMRHDAVPCDTDMLAWVRAREQEVCPEATEIVGRTEKSVNGNDVAALAAEALRVRAGADVAFCHASKVMRDGLPTGDLDVNALFSTGGQRGHDIVSFTMTGAEIENYLHYLITSRNGITEWAGFRGKLERSPSRVDTVVKTNLTPEASYRVAAPEVEWNPWIRRSLQDASGQPAREAAKCDFTFTDAFAAYARELTAKGITLDAQTEILIKAQGL